MNNPATGLTCDEARQWILLADSGELSADDQHVLKQHVEHCSRCMAEQGELPRTMKQAMSMGLEVGPTDATMRVLRTEIWNAAGRRVGSRRLRRTIVAMAAAILVVAFVGWHFVLGSQPAPVREQQAMASLVGVAVELSDGRVTRASSDVSSGSVQELANQLMILEGLSDDPHDLEFMELGDEGATDSTDLRSHNSALRPA